MIPYSVNDNLELALTAAQLIDAYCNLPIYRRHATLRMDVWDGQGIIPQVLHSHTEVRLNGNALEADDYGISGAVFQLQGVRWRGYQPDRHLVEIDGLMGLGSITYGLSDLTYSAGSLTAAAAENVLPVGTALYNSGAPVYVVSVDGLVMTLSGGLIDGDSPERLGIPPMVRMASDALMQDLSIETSTAAIGGDAEAQMKLITKPVARLLHPFRARHGGRATYAPRTATPDFPQTGDAFGPGFGRGFN